MAPTSLLPGLLHTRAAIEPLEYLKNWGPFRIDALGLVTLLGEREVNQAIGTLEKTRLTEYLPLLAAFVVAGKRFTEREPGFALYNITDRIYTTELNAWFTRWLSAQDGVTGACTILTFTLQEDEKDASKTATNDRSWDLVAALLSTILIAPLLVLTILAWDWFAFANTIALVASVLVRYGLLKIQRQSLDNLVRSTVTEVNTRKKENDEPSDPTKTLFVITAEGRMFTIYAHEAILATFVRRGTLSAPEAYNLLTWLGWLAFGVHIISLGMSSLFAQVYTVILLVLSTVLRVKGLPFDRVGSGQPKSRARPPLHICKTIRSKRFDPLPGAKLTTRSAAWACADLDEVQEEVMQSWMLFPFKNPVFYQKYEEAKRSHRSGVCQCPCPERDLRRATTRLPLKELKEGGSMAAVEVEVKLEDTTLVQRQEMRMEAAAEATSG